MIHSGFSHYESFKEHDLSLIDAPISNHLLVKTKNWLTFGSMHACMDTSPARDVCPTSRTIAE